MSTTQAPVMRIEIDSLTVAWDPIAGVSSYVFVRKVPGRPDEYKTVTGTSIKPEPVPGQTVRYGVRTAVSGSAWAAEVSISYPAATVDPKTAPRIVVSGQTLTWNQIGSVTSYVLATKVPGQATRYDTITGTLAGSTRSFMPPVVPGQTVTYGLRTNVEGSTWATEVSIAYAAPTPTPDPTPAPTPAPSGSTLRGVVGGSAHQYEIRYMVKLGAKTARLEFDVGAAAGDLAADIDAYARAGIRVLPLAGFRGRVAGSAEAKNLASWAAAYGPGGSFWTGKSYAVPVTEIEFGNETSYTYQFSDNSLATYATRAQTYALRAKEAAESIRAVNPKVGLLVQGDNAQQGTAWVTNMFRAVANLGDLAAGWTIHPYGPNWATRIDATVNSTKTAGSRDLPIWVTEWGLSTDNGHCLDSNYGFDKCMTYDEASSTLRTTFAGMQSRYGSRLGAFFLYQAHDQAATGTTTGREAYFGGLQSNGDDKGAYTTEVKALLAA